MHFEVLDEEDGLSNSSLYSMARDSSGFLWVGTKEGLNRFDGHEFRVFRHNDKDPNSLFDDGGQYLFVDNKGRLWVGFIGAISQYHPDCQCFTNYFPFGKSKDYQINNVILSVEYVDDEGLVWCGGRGIGLIVFDPKTGRHDRYDLPNILPDFPASDRVNYNSVNQIYASPDGLLWLATINGLYSFDPKTRQFYYHQLAPIVPGRARDDGFLRILPDENNGLWLTSWGGGISYYHFKENRFATYKYIKQDILSTIGNIVFDMVKKNDAEYWLATGDKGLGIFNRQTGAFQFPLDKITTEPGVDKTITSQLIFMPDKTMFLLNGAGLLKFNPNSQLFHFNQLNLASSQNGKRFGINKILEDDKEHTLYFATEFGNGLNILDEKTGKLQAFKAAINPKFHDSYQIIRDLLIDRNGNLWVLARDYLFAFDKHKKVLNRVKNPVTTHINDNPMEFISLQSDPDGEIWVISDQGGLFHFSADSKKFIAEINSDTSLNHAPGTVDRIAFDKHGKMWVLGDGDLFTYNKTTGQFQRPFPDLHDLLTSAYLKGIASDTNGNIWISLNRKGLLRIDTKDPEHPASRLLTESDGLPTTWILRIASDYMGNLWMTTYSGMVYMNTNTMVFRKFSRNSSVERNIVLPKFSNAGLHSFFLTIPGKYCRVNFDAILQEAPLPKVYVDKFSVLNQDQSARLNGQPLVIIHPGEDFFSFDFGCLDFGNQSDTRFAYKLTGWDKDWVQCSSRRFASYTNLNGGNYTFMVKAANGEGQWSQPVNIPVLIETPFYKTAWFMVMVALFITGIIYMLYLYRIRQIERTERLKTEFNRQLAETRLEALRAQMNPHFIFNSLNSINRYIIASDIKTASLYLTRFSKLIRLILDNSVKKKTSLSNELEALQLYIQLEAFRFEHKFSYDISVSEEVDADHVEVPPLIIQPFVENAIWHGLMHKDSGGHLSVHITRDSKNLTCEITDNGIGREKAMEYKSQTAPTRKSVGMKLTEERLHLAGTGGTYRIEDLYDDNGKASGTHIVITLPVKL